MLNAIAKLAAILIVLCFPVGAQATWTPPPGFQPSPAVQAWFDAHKYCCLKAERVRTKFRAIGEGQWQYLDAGQWKDIHPAYGVDLDGVLPTEGFKDALDNDAQFQQLRAEGVLFVFEGSPWCFFVPQSGG